MALFKTAEVIERNDEEDHLYSDGESEDFVICKNPDKLQRLIKSLEPCKTVHYVSDGDWSMHDLIMQLLKQYAPAELFITTYAIREFAIRQMILAQDAGDLTAVNMLLDYRAQVRVPEAYQLASMNMNNIRLMGIHAKVTVLKSLKGFVTIIGSANYTNNPRVESGIITTSPGAAAFHISWIKKLMENAEIFE